MRVIAIKERADGNAAVGTVWVETAIFDTETRLGQVLEWAAQLRHSETLEAATTCGRLMLSVPEMEADK